MKLIIEATPEELSALVTGIWEPPDQVICDELASRGYVVLKDDSRIKN